VDAAIAAGFCLFGRRLAVDRDILLAGVRNVF
jgi:hypothetical protein